MRYQFDCKNYPAVTNACHQSCSFPLCSNSSRTFSLMRWLFHMDKRNISLVGLLRRIGNWQLWPHFSLPSPSSPKKGMSGHVSSTIVVLQPTPFTYRGAWSFLLVSIRVFAFARILFVQSVEITHIKTNNVSDTIAYRCNRCLLATWLLKIRSAKYL